ncbi:hypothetical protein SRABI84_03307 [Peribacillus simplex]|nr:hypothetical protein SRABI84_03307 [Peribacillus simplex]
MADDMPPVYGEITKKEYRAAQHIDINDIVD